MSQKMSLKFVALLACALFLGSGGVSAAVVEAPVFDPPAGAYFDFVEVSLSCATEGALIYYTMDGSDPTVDPLNQYDPTFPIFVEETTVVKALAYKPGSTDSQIVTATYVVTPSPPPTLKVIGPKAFKTRKPTVTIRGTSTNAYEVDYEIASSGIYNVARGVSPWSFKAKLKPGKNVITIYAIGEYEDSNPVTLRITYSKKKK